MLEFGRGGALYSSVTYIPANIVLVQCLSWILIAEFNWHLDPININLIHMFRCRLWQSAVEEYHSQLLLFTHCLCVCLSCLYIVLSLYTMESKMVVLYME